MTMHNNASREALAKTVEQAEALLAMNRDGITVPRVPNLACELLQDFINHHSRQQQPADVVELRLAIIELNAAIDAFWNGNAQDSHVMRIEAAQQRCKKSLTHQPAERGDVVERVANAISKVHKNSSVCTDSGFRMMHLAMAEAAIQEIEGKL